MKEEKIKCLLQEIEVTADLGKINFPKIGKDYNFGKPEILVTINNHSTFVPEKDLSFPCAAIKHRAELAVRRFRDFLGGKKQKLRRRFRKAA